MSKAGALVADGRESPAPHGGRAAWFAVLGVFLCLGWVLRVQAAPSPGHALAAAPLHFVFLVDTSSSMKSRRGGTAARLQELIRTGLYGRIQNGDGFVVWTFSDTVQSNTFPILAWKPETSAELAGLASRFIITHPFEKRARMDRVMNSIFRLLGDDEHRVILVLTDGAEAISGTTFDVGINATFRKYRRELETLRIPFQVLLLGGNGQLVFGQVHCNSGPLVVPDLRPRRDSLVPEPELTRAFEPAQPLVPAPVPAPSADPEQPAPLPLLPFQTTVQPRQITALESPPLQPEERSEVPALVEPANEPEPAFPAEPLAADSKAALPAQDPLTSPSSATPTELGPVPLVPDSPTPTPTTDLPAPPAVQTLTDVSVSSPAPAKPTALAPSDVPEAIVTADKLPVTTESDPPPALSVPPPSPRPAGAGETGHLGLVAGVLSVSMVIVVAGIWLILRLNRPQERSLISRSLDRDEK